MQFQLSIVAPAAVALLSSVAQAAPIEDGPFTLYAVNNGPLNNTGLQTCHEGAGTESLCFLKNGGSPQKFYLNTTTESKGITGKGIPGTLVITVPGSPPQSQGMDFLYQVTSNVAHAQFSPGNEVQQVAFDSNNYMNIQSAYNDTASPPSDSKTAAYYRWYICETNILGYDSTTLNWVLGDGIPENPTCKMTNIQRRRG